MAVYDNLYNSLSYNLPTEDLNTEEKDEIVAIMENLSKTLKDTNEGVTKWHEINSIIFSLIVQDYNKYNPNTKVVFPYKTKQLDDEKLEIKIDCLPIRLKRILQKFIRIAKDNGIKVQE